MTIQMLCAFTIAFLFVTAFGKWYIPWLEKEKAGQEIKAQLVQHSGKSGTPTMGGVMFILSAILVCLTIGFPGMLQGHFEHIFVLLFALIFGAIGLLDDSQKIRKRQNLGLSTRAKFLLQLVAALLFLFLMIRLGFLHTALYLPLSGRTVNVPPVLFYAFAVFVIVGTVNAVNITDGVDGLATGTSIPVFLFFVLVTFAWGQEYLQLGLFASAMVGGLMGFLVYNFNPARVFMGDTGSLFLGGAIAAMAFAYDMPLILIPLCVMFIIETLSDIIQVGYFKITHGKRIFRMAPFHHHLELGGWTGRKWKEKEIFVLYTGVSLLCMVFSFLIVFERYL